MNRLLVLATAGATVLALAGCAASPATPPTPRSTPISSAQPHDTSTTQAPPPPGLSSSAASAAVTAAREVMTHYARPQLSSSAWLAGMDPYLTQDAAAAFAETDPSQIPAHRVTGQPVLSADSTGAGAIATVPTDAGTYQVLLLRAKGSTVWLAEQITQPGQ